MHVQIVHTLKEKESIIGAAEVTCSGALLSAVALFASTNQHFDILCILMHSKHAQIFNMYERFRASL